MAAQDDSQTRSFDSSFSFTRTSKSAASSQVLSIYERQRREACADLQGCYEGSLNALFCVVSSAPATEVEQRAISAVAQRGGFAASEIIWIASSSCLQGDQAENLFRLIETVDPLCVVALDQKAGEALSRAYNQPIGLDARSSILGRPSCCFVDFARMLQTDERKQRAWALLKETLSYVNDL